VLLAGGRGRRMGGTDKALLTLAGRPMLAHVRDRISRQVHAMVINANGDPARFAALGLPVIPDTIPEFPGPLAGVLAGMRWAAAHHPAAADILSVPTDTPFLPADLAVRLCAQRRQPIAVAASAGRLHPVVALWPVALADALEAALRAGERKVQAWMRRQGLSEVAFTVPASGDPFANINTPDDLLAAEARLTRRTGPAPCDRP